MTNFFTQAVTHRGITVLTSILVSGCMVGPDYMRPPFSAPEEWKIKTGKISSKQKDEAWWINFKDPTLDELIQRAYKQNLDLKLALSRLMEARAIYGVYKADLFPKTGVGGVAQRARNNLPLAPLKPYNNFIVQLDCQWELDFFGKVQRQMEAAQALFELAWEDYHKVMVTLQADIAKSYFTIRNLQNQIRITQVNIKIQENSLTLTQRQKEAGQSNKLDVLRAQSQLWSTQSQLPFYESALSQAKTQLEFLLAENPKALDYLLDKPQPVPVMNVNLVLAAPATVILQRPDVSEAERALAAATALHGATIAEQYPSISLAGFLGFHSVLTNKLFTVNNKSWGGGGKITQPIFAFGKIRSKIKAADARQQEAFFNYKKTVLAALSEVENALVAYFKEEERRQTLEKNLQTIKEAVVLAKKRYQEGLSSFLEVLDAERTLYQSESQLAQSAADVSLNLVSLYKALGGGWKAHKQSLNQEGFPGSLPRQSP